MKNRQAEIIRELSSRELLFHLYLTQLILFIISCTAVYFLFDQLSSFLHLFQYDLWWIAIGAINGVAVVIIDIVLMSYLPDRYYDDGGLNEKLFSTMPGWQIPVVALVVAISEELLFRGVIQTTFGIVVATLIFALVHTRYLSHWFLLTNIIVLSFWIGFIYQLSGEQLLPVMAMHFTIDCLLGFYIKYHFSHKESEKGNSYGKES